MIGREEVIENKWGDGNSGREQVIVQYKNKRLEVVLKEKGKKASGDVIGGKRREMQK